MYNINQSIYYIKNVILTTFLAYMNAVETIFKKILFNQLSN